MVNESKNEWHTVGNGYSIQIDFILQGTLRKIANWKMPE